MACGILVSQPGIEPMPLAVKGQSPNLWTLKEFQNSFYFKRLKIPKKNVLTSVTSVIRFHQALYDAGWEMVNQFPLVQLRPHSILSVSMVPGKILPKAFTGDTRGQSLIHQDTEL